jgi:hypothetical protein
LTKLLSFFSITFWIESQDNKIIPIVNFASRWLHHKCLRVRLTRISKDVLISWKSCFSIISHKSRQMIF